MKFYNKVQVLQDGETKLWFNDRLAASVGIAPNVTLHGVLLKHCRPEVDSHVTNPSHMLVLSPFPVATWRNLIRASFTVKPESGAILEILENLEASSIYVRHLELTNGADLCCYGLPASRDKQALGDEGQENWVVPSAALTLELPALRNIHKINDSALHKRLQILHRMTYRPDDARAGAEARESLGEIAGSAVVDWAAPLGSLNRLGRLSCFYGKEDLDCSQFKGFGPGAWVGNTGEFEESNEFLIQQSERDRVSQTFTVRVGESENKQNPFSIDIGAVGEHIWERRKSIPEILPSRTGDNRLAICYSDPGEKLICWDVFDPRSAVLVALELVVPTGGREHTWYRWLLKQVESAAGNVLTMHASARLDGDWGIIEAVVLFPFDDPTVESNEKQRAILACLRRLQGYEGGTGSLDDLQEKTERKAGDLIEGRRMSLLDKKPRTKSTLHIRNLWDLRGNAGKSASSTNLVSSKLNFTRALQPTSYSRLYGEGGEDTVDWRDSSLAKLATKICDRLRYGENILVVGANRSGKTSLSSLVDQFLGFDVSTPEIIGGPNERRGATVSVRVPSYTLPMAIMPLIVTASLRFLDSRKAKFEQSEGDKWWNQDKDGLERARLLIKGVADFLETPFINLVNKGNNLELVEIDVTASGEAGVRAPILKVGAAVQVKAKLLLRDAVRLGRSLDAFDELTPSQLLNHGIWATDSSSSAQLTVIAARSVEMLQACLEQVNQYAGFTLLQPVVMIDEFNRFDSHGNEAFVRAWREMIETSNMSQLRWFVTSESTTDESQRLRPMSGTFREWVLGPISAYDCDLLFEHFAGIQRKKSSPDSEDPYAYALKETEASGSDWQVVYPVITFTAREFLKRITDRMPYFMQVFLVHLHEHAQKQVLPVINRLWCERVFFDKVLPQLSEYLLGQWNSVPSDVQREIEVALRGCGVDGPTLLRSFGGRHSGSYPPDPEHYRAQSCDNPAKALEFTSELFSARARTVLRQVGLTAGDSTIIAPLVAVWILERQGKSEMA